MPTAVTALLDAPARADARVAPTSEPSLDMILRPRSIAVVGASRAANTIGHQIVDNLVRHGYAGAVYPVNPRAASVHSMPCWPTVSALPQAVDTAVVCVPKEHVVEVARECGEKGVRGLVVISAGFREIGASGAARERELVQVARAYGMRLVGPNCMGVINTDPAVSMNSTFVPVMPPFGRAAFVSQSGAIGANVLDYATDLGIGIAQFVSMGNKPDVSGNDLLLHWEHDEQIRVILMYVESFGNPGRFLEIASRVTRTKPVIVVKAGRSAVGARAASSHTGALAASDAAVDAMLRQAGALRASSIEELFDMAMAFASLRPPRSRRTAVVTNSGGPGVLAADALEMHGLDVVDLAPGTVARLQPLFPAEASIRNPLDMIASANATGYRAALGAVLDDPSVDSALAIFTPPLGVRTEDVALAIGEVAAERPHKPVLAVLMGRDGLPQGKAELNQAGVPAFIFPESAARALAALARQGDIEARPPRQVPAIAADRDAARAIVARARAAGITKLAEHEAMALVAAYGIPTVGGGLARTAEEAVRLAEAAGHPVVLKVVSAQVVHKSDVGGVRLGLRDADAIRAGYAGIIEAVSAACPDATIDGVLVQREAPAARELIAGFSREREFGAVVMAGLGGIWVEAIRDVSFRVAPLDMIDAREMLHELRSARLLGALRGRGAADVDAVADVLVRIGRLALDLPEVAELDLNPLLVDERGALAVDARVILEERRA
jgi:acetyl coenzyme A synthetase (ADP forming)-like protein